MKKFRNADGSTVELEAAGYENGEPWDATFQVRLTAMPSSNRANTLSVGSGWIVRYRRK